MRRAFRVLRRLGIICVVAGCGGLLMILATVGYVASHIEGNASLPVECGVVFGAAVHSVDNPGPGITRRVETAARLYNEGQIERLYFTGGKGSQTQQSEAEVMRRVALLQGVDPEDIVLEPQATSTWENLLFTRPLAEKCESIVGISDRYHLARIEYLAETQGWGSLQTYPADQVATRPFEIRSMVREAFGLLYYFAMHRTLQKSLTGSILHME